MSYEVYYNVFFIGGLVLAAIMLIISVVIFFVLNIPHVFGDLSGRNAAKAIADIRSQNEGEGQSRSKNVDKMTLSGSLRRNPSRRLTAPTAPEPVAPQGIPSQTSETTVLGTANETTVLGTTNETTVLGTANETTVLNAEAGATSILRAPTDASSIQIEYEITYIHTDDVIA